MQSYPTKGRKSQEHAPIDDVDERGFRELVQTCLGADHGHLKSVAKEVADIADASPETAKTWLNGLSSPGFLKGLKLAARSPSLKKEVIRLIAAESDLSPEFQEQLAVLLRMMGR